MHTHARTHTHTRTHPLLAGAEFSLQAQAMGSEANAAAGQATIGVSITVAIVDANAILPDDIIVTITMVPSGSTAQGGFISDSMIVYCIVSYIERTALKSAINVIHLSGISTYSTWGL